ncbi:MAG: hypothetical protein QM781_04435 [Chitinophagaceae bacterium]
MKKIFFLLFLSITSAIAFAQSVSFDVVSFTVPKNWQQQLNEVSMQLSVTDKKTGAYAIALITKSTASDANATENFNSDWNRLVKGSVQVNTEPSLLEPANENGWKIISGTANYTDGSQKGLATLLTATGGGQMTSVLLMTNTDKYQNELLSFINSLELAKASSQTPIPGNTANTNDTNSSSIVGMWVFYNTESSGTYNGFLQLTGGYMRREYVFYEDGSYLFRAKDWMVYVKDILFIYETGTYTLNGNQITITPKKGKGEWWSKAASGRTNEWGKPVRASTNYKLETTTYTFDFSKYQGNDEITLTLKSVSPTERDGKDGDKTGVQEFRYKSRDIKKSLIDNPPGFKAGAENK